MLLLQANARHLPLPSNYVQCVVTSPPYWGLRDYKTTPLIWGGAEGCEHEWGDQIVTDTWGLQINTAKKTIAGPQREDGRGKGRGCWCVHCGAWRGSLGLEPTPDLYVQHLVEVFREVRRVLRDDGTCWVNLGDCYATGAGKVGDHPGGGRQGERWAGRGAHTAGNSGKAAYRLAQIGPMTQPNRMPIPGLKPKDLVGIPWMLAFALRADGWYLRSEIIWAKGVSFRPDFSGSCMPESVRDRPTRSHETVFLLTKSERYYYDHEAVKEDGAYPQGTRAAKGSGDREGNRRPEAYAEYSGKRNLRSVWAINPQPFAAELCVACGRYYDGAEKHQIRVEVLDGGQKRRWCLCGKYDAWLSHFATFPEKLVEPMIKAGSAHWQQDQSRCVVLDPFCGSGTVGKACRATGRFFIGCDLNPVYLQMAQHRIMEL